MKFGEINFESKHSPHMLGSLVVEISDQELWTAASQKYKSVAGLFPIRGQWQPAPACSHSPPLVLGLSASMQSTKAVWLHKKGTRTRPVTEPPS